MSESTLPTGSLPGTINIENGTLDVDLNETPNEIPMVPPGIFRFEIKSSEFALNKEQSGYNLAVKMEVVGDANGNPVADNGRSIGDWIPIDPDPKMRVKLRLFTLASLSKIPAKVVAAEYVGKLVVASIVHNQSKDKTKMYANIKEYIVPPDVLAANPVKK
jgi:hypothetical protein